MLNYGRREAVPLVRNSRHWGLREANKLRPHQRLVSIGLTAPKATAEDQQVANLIHACWVAFAKQAPEIRSIACPEFDWPARTDANGQAVAVFKSTPSLGRSPDLRSPPNGAAPGPTSRDEE